MSAHYARPLPAEAGRRTLFGKPYHWVIRNGQHHLLRCTQPGNTCIVCGAE